MRLRYTYLLTTLLLLVAHGAFAQSFTISGIVKSATCFEPVSDVEVSLNKMGMRTKTDSNGYFLMANLSPDNYRMMIFREGYATHMQRIEVKQDVHLDIQVTELDQELEAVEITDKSLSFSKDHLRQVDGTAIYAGKKTEVVKLEKVQGNLAANNARQIYAKIAGLNIWESDGSGLQLDIGGRGLNPSRSSNFNMRQNGYDISADALGYPESYYSPPSEAIDQIEIVRGAASLQYGTQFGGMVNFKLKQGDTKKPIGFETRQTAGSFGFYNTFNAIGGSKGKFNYYAFYQYKRADGWRPNSGFQQHTGHIHLGYQVTPALQLSAEYTVMHYLAQQPGGLTDAMFEADATQSIRPRNWFRVRWNLMALNMDWKLSARTRLDSRFFGLIADRYALGLIGLPGRTDPLQERDLIVGKFKNFGNETRLIHRYYLGDNISNFLVGARVYYGFTENKQGLASDGFGPDFDYLNPNDLENADYEFPSQNIAVFAENVFGVHPKVTITPGVRFEHISTSADGYYRERATDLADNIIFDQKVNDQRDNVRKLFLAGIGIGYKPMKGMELYGNFSQNYRAITFNDMRVYNPNFRIDPDLKDERGYTIDLGLRGDHKGWLTYDASVFFLKYDNRIGEVLLRDTLLYNLYRYRTNISDSRTVGVETYVEVDVWRLATKGQKTDHSLAIYANVSLQNARYINSDQPAFEGKKVELVPEMIVRTGIQYRWKQLRVSYQVAYTDEQFTDATNAEVTPSGINGLIPSYYIMDVSASYTWKGWLLSTGINNLMNNKYFTRRATGYPGPGIIPADPLNFFVTLGYKF